MAGGHTSWLVGGGVVLVGVAAAMPFYRGAADMPQPAASLPAEKEVPWSGDPLTLRVSSDPPRRSTTAQPQRDVAVQPKSRWEDEPPRVDGEYGGLLDRFRPTSPQQISSDPGLRALSISASEFTQLPDDSAAPSPIQPSRAAQVDLRPALPEIDRLRNDEEPPVEKKHSIVDGDTLERIAERYYGDAFYASAIFERNRHVLSDPALLPVGEQLVIPSRQTVLVEPTLPLESLTGSGANRPSDTPQTTLVPLQ